MSAHLKRQCLYNLSIGVVNESSYKEKSDWFNDCDTTYGIMCLAMSPKLYYLINSVEYPFELYSNLEIFWCAERRS